MTSNIPEKFKERYCQLVDDEDEFLSSLEQLLPKSFRVNTLKSSAAEVQERFDNYGIACKQMSWYSDAFVSESVEIGTTLEHFTGAIYLQELVSMLPPLLVRKELGHPGQAQIVLDACAAPGSKTTQLAALMGNAGTIIANDVDYSRIKALKFNLEKTGTLNTIITNRDLRTFPELQFEVILLDVPCSAEGTARKSDSLFRIWSERLVRGNSKLQKQLILKAFDLLAPGGVMIYSTCTFAPEENEEVIDWLLKNRPAHLRPISFDGLKTSPPVHSWNGNEFDSEVRNAVRIWPHHNNTGGFFMAKVEK
jgi:NOL1/NOP2/sun family putative RNA methylase